MLVRLEDILLRFSKGLSGPFFVLGGLVVFQPETDALFKKSCLDFLVFYSAECRLGDVLVSDEKIRRFRGR